MRLIPVFSMLAIIGQILLSGCSATAESNLAGHWKGVDSSGTEALVEFSPGNKLSITANGQAFHATWESESCGSPLQLKVFPDGKSERYIPLVAEIDKQGELMLTAGTDLKFRPSKVASDLDTFSARLQRIP